VGTYDEFRTLLNIRQQRKRPPVGPVPGIGASIVIDDFRIVVQAELSEALWKFLVQAGFREVSHRPERRRYRDVPPSLVAGLYSAPPEQWQAVLVAALREATKLPRDGVGTRAAPADS
jgi:hypothetical protein